MAADGQLPKWSDWFGRDAIRVVVPNDEQREAIVAELPQLPLGYFEQSVPMPDAWATYPCAYVLLSEPYRQDAAEARARGWPTIEVRGNHLDIVTRPREVVDALLEAADA